MKTRKFLSVAFFNISIWSNIIRSKSVMVGGAAMYPSKHY
jgi:hypothetical protein